MSNDLNYSSIHYDKFHKILAITNNHQRAAVLDKLIFWSLNSDYFLPRSSDKEKWFTQTYQQMSDKTKVPISTLKKYMAYFEKEGWLVRVRKKLGENVRAFFRVTKKLLLLLGLKNKKSSTSFTMPQTGTSKSSAKEFSILKDNKLKSINTIDSQIEIKKEAAVPEIVKELYQKNRAQFSISEKQLLAEIEYTLENPNFLKNTSTLRHKLNIIKKLIRDKKWMTPKGFFKHSEKGKELKKKLPYLQENKENKKEDTLDMRNKLSKEKIELRQRLFVLTSQKNSLITLSKHDPTLCAGLSEIEDKEQKIIQQIALISDKIKSNVGNISQLQRE